MTCLCVELLEVGELVDKRTLDWLNKTNTAAGADAAGHSALLGIDDAGAVPDDGAGVGATGRCTCTAAIAGAAVTAGTVGADYSCKRNSCCCVLWQLLRLLLLLLLLLMLLVLAFMELSV